MTEEEILEAMEYADPDEEDRLWAALNNDAPLLRRVRRVYEHARCLTETGQKLSPKQARILHDLMEQARRRYGDDFWEEYGFPVDPGDCELWTEHVWPVTTPPDDAPTPSGPGRKVIKLADERERIRRDRVYESTAGPPRSGNDTALGCEPRAASARRWAKSFPATPRKYEKFRPRASGSFARQGNCCRRPRLRRGRR